MNTAQIISILEEQKDLIDTAIAALRGSGKTGGRKPGTRPGAKRHLSAAAKKRISDAMKKRWAARKKQV
jgi:hypothetical protein